MKKRIKLTILFFSAITIAYILLGFYNKLEVTYYDVHSDKVDSPIKIALVTDLHSCDYGKNAKELVSAIDDANPDLILLGGDIVDDGLSRDHAIDFFEAIEGRYPTFYVSGNHEYWSHDIDNIKSLIESYGIIILEGESVELEINSQTILLSGIDDPNIADYKEGHDLFRNQLTAVKNNPNNLYHIFLTHRPYWTTLSMEDYYDDPVFDLVLTGHAHGGQWQLPPFNKGIFSPEQGLLPEYTGGLYEFSHVEMILSRGLARESTKVFRFYNRPELPIITIH